MPNGRGASSTGTLVPSWAAQRVSTSPASSIVAGRPARSARFHAVFICGAPRQLPWSCAGKLREM